MLLLYRKFRKTSEELLYLQQHVEFRVWKYFLYFSSVLSKLVLKESPISINFIVFRVIVNLNWFKSSYGYSNPWSNLWKKDICHTEIWSLLIVIAQNLSCYSNFFWCGRTDFMEIDNQIWEKKQKLHVYKKICLISIFRKYLTDKWRSHNC